MELLPQPAGSNRGGVKMILDISQLPWHFLGGLLQLLMVPCLVGHLQQLLHSREGWRQCAWWRSCCT